MSTPVISAAMAVALTTAMGVATLKDAPPAAPSPAQILVFTNAAPVSKFAPKPTGAHPPGVYLAHPYTMMVLVPGRVDPALIHGESPAPWTDDAVQDRHFKLVPRE
jgi:hypothetical protein